MTVVLLLITIFRVCATSWQEAVSVFGKMQPSSTVNGAQVARDSYCSFLAHAKGGIAFLDLIIVPSKQLLITTNCTTIFFLYISPL